MELNDAASLRQALIVRPEVVDDEVLWTQAHLHAVASRVLVVTGLRGSGKTAFADQLARNPGLVLSLRPLGVPDGAVRFVVAAPAPDPTASALLGPDGAVRAPVGDVEQRLHWVATSIQAVRRSITWEREVPPLWAIGEQGIPEARVATAQALAWLDGVHNGLTSRGESVVVLFDEPPGPIGSLISTWIALSDRYPRIRALILVRPEVLETASLTAAERVRLDGRVASLTWTRDDLFRVLVRRIERSGGRGRSQVRDAAPLSVTLPESLDAAAVARLCQMLVGSHIGEGPLRTATADWVFETLRARRGEVVPSQFLALFEQAALWEHERADSAGRVATALSPDGLQAALFPVARRALDELGLDLPEAAALWDLQSVPFPSRRDIVQGVVGRRVYERLANERVLREVANLVDLPELYRVALGARRIVQEPSPQPMQPRRLPPERGGGEPEKAMSSDQVRGSLVDALRLDLVGPEPEDQARRSEVLPTSPSTWYLTGFLVPFEAAEADPTESEQVDIVRPRAGVDDDAAPEQASKRKAPFPSSIGLSVLVPAGVRTLAVHLSWGDYQPAEAPEGTAATRRQWARSFHEADLVVAIDDHDPIDVPDSGGLRVQVASRVVPPTPGGHAAVPPGTRAVSVFLVNQRPPSPDVGRDAAFVFQARLAVSSSAPFVARPDLRGHGGSERDERVAELQYRDVFEFAVGHGVATVVEVDGEGRCHAVRTEWVPSADVERVEPTGVPGVELGMDALANLADAAAARAALEALPATYAQWILTERGTALETEPRRALARELLDAADFARARIAAGLALLDQPEVLDAFRWANRVMAAAARQRASAQSGKPVAEVNAPTWRPFQLAFLLLNLRGIVEPAHADRRTVDLLFFPTGGGKTEAYLGLAAFTLLWRRMANPGLQAAGVAVIMRYTLRLLTFDQLGRAAALVCALELERQREPERLGAWPFEIGLWVGQAATPNRMGDKDKADPNTARVRVDHYLRGKGPCPIPLENCPWCGTAFRPVSFQLVPNANYPTDLRIICVNRSCPFTGRNPLPILTVDEPIYRRLPCFLIATVDKFAQLPWVAESGKLLGKAERYDGAGFYGPSETGSGAPLPVRDDGGMGLLPPDLVIQDELHLISGPLGTMVGLFETAIDALSTRDVDGAKVAPKIVASTATVRRAERQIQALFGRSSVEVFPPPGPNRRDSFFAETVTVEVRHGRRYLGVAAQGRSLKVVFLRTLLALTGAAQTAWEAAGGKRAKPNPADPYMSLVAYFNSLRELGGSRRIVEDEVASRLVGYGSRLRVGETVGPFRDRRIGQPVELTSRESTSKVAETKRRLEQTFHDDERIDVALATNMISVGLDITRLGLMVVVGQPKMSSEYIQATSRVGRDPDRPGLVVTLMNIHRPRDRSHYERFDAFHASFYRSVEATSVTPFSPRAIDRGVAGVTVALARHGLRSLTAPADAVRMRTERSHVDFVADALADRAARHDRDLEPAERDELRARVRGRVADLLDDWVRVADRKHNAGAGLQYQRERGDAPPLLRDPLNPELNAVSPEERRFKANRSMRDVEVSVNLWAKTLDGLDVAAEDE